MTKGLESSNNTSRNSSDRRSSSLPPDRGRRPYRDSNDKPRSKSAPPRYRNDFVRLAGELVDYERTRAQTSPIHQEELRSNASTPKSIASSDIVIAPDQNSFSEGLGISLDGSMSKRKIFKTIESYFGAAFESFEPDTRDDPGAGPSGGNGSSSETEHKASSDNKPHTSSQGGENQS